MPDSPISGLAALAVAEGGDLLAIVDDPLGFPVTKKITVDALADSTLAIGQIYTNDAAGSQTLTLASTWYKVTQWDNNGFGANTTPDQANDKIVMDVTGLFIVSYQVSFSGSANSRYRFQVRWNGAQQLQTQATRVIGTAG
ncbi:MAG: hypothetical protein MUP90_11455, partial [Gammaproteobacteria bacterium]|nr:hypothetical protein [Gammaproteobacteria bacterium]